MDIKPKYVTLSQEQYEHMLSKMDQSPNLTDNLKKSLSLILNEFAKDEHQHYARRAGELIRSTGISISLNGNVSSDEDRFKFDV